MFGARELTARRYSGTLNPPESRRPRGDRGAAGPPWRGSGSAIPRDTSFRGVFVFGHPRGTSRRFSVLFVARRVRGGRAETQEYRRVALGDLQRVAGVGKAHHRRSYRLRVGRLRGDPFRRRSPGGRHRALRGQDLEQGCGRRASVRSRQGREHLRDRRGDADLPGGRMDHLRGRAPAAGSCACARGRRAPRASSSSTWSWTRT